MNGSETEQIIQDSAKDAGMKGTLCDNEEWNLNTALLLRITTLTKQLHTSYSTARGADTQWNTSVH